MVKNGKIAKTDLLLKLIWLASIKFGFFCFFKKLFFYISVTSAF